MKLITGLLCSIIILSMAACRQKKPPLLAEFSGTYIEQQEFPGQPATLKIREVQPRLFMIKLDSAKAVVVAKEGMLSGVFQLPLKGEFPFNFKKANPETGILRIKNKVIRFKKTT